MTTVYRFYHYLARFLYVLLTRRRRVRGMQHLPQHGPAIIIGNHISYIDPVLMMAYAPRQVYYMAKIETFDVPVLRRAARHVGAFPVRRGKVDRTSLRHAEQLLSNGQIVGIFPEGSRSKDQRLQDARGGVVLLANKTGVPIVPAAVTGTERVFRSSFPYYAWAPVTLELGPPFTLAELAAQAGTDDRDVLATLIMERVAALLPPEYRRTELAAPAPLS